MRNMSFALTTQAVTQKQYAHRDIMGIDKAGGYYCRHVSAMTGEGLHSKSDIAAELAWRDMEIDRLKAIISQSRAQDAATVAVGEGK